MTSTHPNLYKPMSSKFKLKNIYPYDSLRPGNISDDRNRGKSSSPRRLLNQNNFNKLKTNNQLRNNNFTSYNNFPFKFTDSVKYY